MEFYLDTANLESIKKINDFYPIKGVTTNPSIISKEKKDFRDIIENILVLIGKEKYLHIQTISKEFENIVKEAELIISTFGNNIYIKIPVTSEGVKAMKYLSSNGFKITATGILSPQQIIMAAELGAEYMAPYINRSDNIGESGIEIIKDAFNILEKNKKTSSEVIKKFNREFEPKIFGASFKNVRQVHEAMLAGAKAVTIGTDIFEQLIYHQYTDWSIDKFDCDWSEIYGNKTLLDILSK